MPLHNDTLDPAALPRWQCAALTPVARQLAPCHALSIMGRWVLVAGLIWLFPAPAEELIIWKPVAAGGALLLGLLMAGLGWVEARRRAYAVRQHDLIYRRGLLVQRSRVLPAARLQHVETLSNPLERAFGLVRLVCFTAGGRGADLVLEGLPAERAEAVKQHLLARVSGRSVEEESDDTA